MAWMQWPCPTTPGQEGKGVTLASNSASPSVAQGTNKFDPKRSRLSTQLLQSLEEGFAKPQSSTSGASPEKSPIPHWAIPSSASIQQHGKAAPGQACTFHQRYWWALHSRHSQGTKQNKKLEQSDTSFKLLGLISSSSHWQPPPLEQAAEHFGRFGLSGKCLCSAQPRANWSLLVF